jgi:hypothetical protein
MMSPSADEGSGCSTGHQTRRFAHKSPCVFAWWYGSAGLGKEGGAMRGAALVAVARPWPPNQGPSKSSEKSPRKDFLHGSQFGDQSPRDGQAVPTCAVAVGCARADSCQPMRPPLVPPAARGRLRSRRTLSTAPFGTLDNRHGECQPFIDDIGSGESPSGRTCSARVGEGGR